MYRVAICSDKKRSQSKLVNALLKISIELDFEFQINLFSFGEELLKHYREENENFHIIIVDTKIEDIKSTELIKNIRSVYDSEFKTVILAENTEYVLKNLEIQPFSYILDPINHSIFRRKIIDICKDIERSDGKYVFISSGGEDILLKYSDIILIESAKELSSKGKLEVETVGRKYIAKGKLSDYAEKLRNHYFLQIHRSYVVNLDYINKVKSKSVVLKDDRELPIGRTKVKDIRAAYSRFVL